MQIVQKVRLEWKVEDPVYPYQGVYFYSPEEFQQLDFAAVKAQQEADYGAWLEMMRSLEQEK